MKYAVTWIASWIDAWSSPCTRSAPSSSAPTVEGVSVRVVAEGARPRIEARVLSRRQVMERLWDSPFVGDARAYNAHISNLCRKVERDPAHPERIVTVREAGYKLVDR